MLKLFLMIKKINLFLIIFTIIYSLYYFAVPAVINSDTNKSFIKSVIKNQSGIDLDYKNTKIKMGFLVLRISVGRNRSL